MKVLDRYLLRELIVPIIYASFSLVFLILVADLFDNLDEFIKHQTPFSVIMKYYGALIPHSFNQTIPWAAWIGTLFLLVNLGFHNETVAMKAAGLKISTITRPILFVGFLIGIASFLISDRVVPNSLHTARNLRESYTGKNPLKGQVQAHENVTHFSGGDQIYFFRRFSPETNRVEGVVALWLGNKRPNSRQKMIAQSGVYSDQGWKFEGVTEYQMGARGQILGDPKTFPQKSYPEILFTPKELESSSSDLVYLNYREMKDSIRRLKENGVRVHSEMVDLYSRLAAPWQGLVMMLIAIPLLAQTTNRKRIAFNVLLCVGMLFAFQLTSAIGLAMGKSGALFPFVGAWAGNIIFATGALFYLDRANY